MRGLLPYRGVSADWFGPDSVEDEQPWQLYAACQGGDLDLFFPEERKLIKLAQQAEDAKAVCRQCPVSDECLDYARRNREKWGIWGGVDFEEPLREHRRTRQRTAGQRSAA